jgi:membrane associated rhomboid family serine protease
MIYFGDHKNNIMVLCNSKIVGHRGAICSLHRCNTRVALGTGQQSEKRVFTLNHSVRCSHIGGDKWRNNSTPRRYSDDIDLDYVGTVPKKPQSGGMGQGVFIMLLLNFVLHNIAYFWNPPWIHSLALSHMHPKPWQFVTAAFVHANWDHLFGNAFSLLVFGRMVEEEEGAFGLWTTYIICGITGNIASYLSSPGTASVSLGASSAVFGLFIVGVLTKLRPNLKQLMEALILGSFVIKQVLQEVHMVTSGSSIVVAGQMTVGHMAHLGGALGGVLLVLLLSRLPPVS